MKSVRLCKIERGDDVVYLNCASASPYGIECSDDTPAGLYLTVRKILEEADKTGVTQEAYHRNCEVHTGRLVKWINENYKDSGIKAEYIGPVFKQFDDDEEDLTEGISEEIRKELEELNKQLPGLTVE